MRQNPLALLLRALRLWQQKRVRFQTEVDSTTLVDHEETFLAFRKVVVAPGPLQPPRPGAIFRVRFRFKNLSATANRWLSLIPIPLILAQPGFRSKTWLLGTNSGDFIGSYDFDSVETAQQYWDSLPLRMMRKRAAPGSLTSEIHQT